MNKSKILGEKFPENSTDKNLVYENISESLLLEGSAHSNLATFCQTHMEKEAVDLMVASLSKNIIDKSEYPQITEFEKKCLSMISDLWHGTDNTIGTSTVGSSEACMLAGLAMKKRFENYCFNQNIKLEKRPNLIISSANQVCWEKFSVYFNVELNIINVENVHSKIEVDKIINAIDAYTIGVVGILGITYTGKYDDIQKIDTQLKQYNSKSNFPLYMHVDAASGGLYTPFVQPELNWDFKLDTVVSINTSGHKYGLIYPGIGWLMFKSKKFIDKSMLFDVSYLGGEVSTISLNFSHSASNLVAQYYNFMYLGFEGYKKIHMKTKQVANELANFLSSYENIQIINDGNDLPIVCYALNYKHDKNWNLYDLSDQLLQRGWKVPTYPLPENIEKTIVSRIVCRRDLTQEMLTVLIKDIQESIFFLDEKNITFYEKANHISNFRH